MSCERESVNNCKVFACQECNDQRLNVPCCTFCTFVRSETILKHQPAIRVSSYSVVLMFDWLVSLANLDLELPARAADGVMQYCCKTMSFEVGEAEKSLAVVVFDSSHSLVFEIAEAR